eukprot:12821036-Alexandrium_andersonii.AAC.1
METACATARAGRTPSLRSAAVRRTTSTPGPGAATSAYWTRCRMRTRRHGPSGLCASSTPRPQPTPRSGGRSARSQDWSLSTSRRPSAAPPTA